MDIGEDFFETAAGQTIAGAHRYLSATRVLRYSKEWGPLIQVPTLNLLGHGIELLFKFPLLAGGMSAKDVRKGYGHDLTALWNDAHNDVLRRAALDQAERALAEAKASGKWPTAAFGDQPARQELVYAVEHMSYLHGAESDYALRYIITPNTYAPRPAFLIDVFGALAEQLVKNPRLLQLWREDIDKPRDDDGFRN
ncbi:hypothetical protein FHT87_002192 [Rhizobium sp. BK316]|uniref:hypothetical protein n=1 Tax=Rhizobium sp. BK316 TaxID=2587053 RepID=UPI00161B15A1|nr:hypothetical protein [Rhizobium sp. BK316]MBB3408289.1 hypothetical protein [Rhizobium sp. BK316]